MSGQKTLAIVRMPAGATPQTHLAAGPWCFAGQEEAFPDWENAFAFAPEPLDSPEALDNARRHVWALTAEYLPLAGRHIESRRGLAPLPAVFWETALMPSMLMISQMLVERLLRVRAMIDLWGGQPLRVPLLPANCEFSFAGDYELSKQGFQGYAFNHWLFSRYLSALWPAAWEALPLPPVCECAAPAPSGPRGRLRELGKKMAYAPFFPHLKGFSPFHSFAFSLALLLNRNQEDRSLPLPELARRNALPPAADIGLPLDPWPIFLMALPRVLEQAPLPARIRPARRKRTRVASVAAIQDTAYRLRLARWRAAGHKLAYVQHGGNYGMLRCAATTPLEEYCQHAFVTWGWRTQTPLEGNFIPLPHAQTTALLNRRREREKSLLFVGNGMELFPSRLDSRPNPAQFLAYRRMKADFLAALPPEILDCVSYRPYFDVPASLRDWPWLHERFAGLRRCAGSLDAAMLSCRLMVLDHHGTTLNLAFAAGTPLILYWDPRAWELCPEGAAMLDLLHQAGIWRPTPGEAAERARAVWDDADGWWRTPGPAEARRRWRAQYALAADGGFFAQWMRALRTL